MLNKSEIIKGEIGEMVYDIKELNLHLEVAVVNRFKKDFKKYGYIILGN